MYRKIVGSVATLLAVFLAAAGVVIVAGAGNAYASSLEIVGSSRGIVIKPADQPLFTMNNMAPGRSESSTVTVINDGKEDFTFSISAKKQSGDDILFDGLQIEAADADGKLFYSGPLSGLQGKELGKVAAGGSKDFAFTITFPKAIGSECQGKTLSMQFVFAATGSSGDDDHDNQSNRDELTEPEEPEAIVEPAEEVIPAMPVETDEPEIEEPLETIPDVPFVPTGTDTGAELPKTGEFPPIVIHGIGLAIILAGLLLRRRRPA